MRGNDVRGETYWFENFEKIWKLEKKWNIGNLKLIETENGSTEQELQDLEDRPRHGNLRFDGIT